MKEFLHIAIADDHQLVIDGIRSLLSTEDGIKIVMEANDGPSLLQQVELIIPDILLLDINMPGMSGMEVMAVLRKKQPGIKVIVLSMHNESAIVKRFAELGAMGYVLKNADKAELMEAIRQVAAGTPYFSGEVTLSLLKPEGRGKVRADKLQDIPVLTSRESEILRLVAEGLSNKEISDRLFISHRTVDTHRTNLMRKIGVTNVAGLIRFAIRHGYIS